MNEEALALIKELAHEVGPRQTGTNTIRCRACGFAWDVGAPAHHAADCLHIRARKIINTPGVKASEPCRLGKGCQPDPNCTNRHQCWEPCGELGNDPKHVRVASEKDTAAINKALGVPPSEGGQQ